MIVLPVPYRRRRNRPAKVPSAGPPPGPPVQVASVTVVDEQWADWEFSRPVTLLNPSGDWSMVQIDTTNGTQSASEAIQNVPTIVRFHFDDSGVAAHQVWRLTGATPPGQLDLHGAVLVVPASGVVVGD